MLSDIAAALFLSPHHKAAFRIAPSPLFLSTKLHHKMSLEKSAPSDSTSHNELKYLETKNEIELVFLCGLDSEGRTVLFGWGWVNLGLSEYMGMRGELYSWIFSKFIEGMGAAGDEMFVMCEYDRVLADAVVAEFGGHYERLTVRYCQVSVRKKVVETFPNDDDDKATELEKRLILLIRDLIYVEDPEGFDSLVDAIFAHEMQID